ncbi:trypsin alpha-3 [Folsomia candida]|uniref:trypsin alpha-3 n=1 Tax=Folsomia candida TaxID=158441 RepID=UPI00160534D3|nr:trypsin alpha-3 [Folsomia candida]
MVRKTTIFISILFFTLPISSGNEKEGRNLKIAKARKTQPQKRAGETNCACGKVATNTAPKIVGGKKSQNHASPWLGALVYTGGSQPSQFCGSSLINDRYVVTAGHCVVGKITTTQGYQVFLGSNKINGTDAKRVNIVGVIVHPNYNSQTLENDIALIQLAEQIKITPKIRPICLAKGPATFAGKNANVAGWGTQQKGGNAVNQLRNAWVKIMENSVCAKNYTTAKVKITPNMLCASLPGRDSCSGDSGGALVVKENADTFRQVGVVSFGIDCGNTHYPGVYTRITRYYKWILENTQDAIYCSK